MGRSHKQAEFALVQKRIGSSSYNVLGVGNVTYVSESGRPNFMSFFAPSQIVTIQLNGSSGSLWLGGKRSDHPPSQFMMPMEHPPFFRCMLHSFRCGDIQIPPTMLPRRGVIFDTGSNMLDLPTYIYNKIQPALEQNQPIELMFPLVTNDGHTNLIRIRYQSNQYRWKNSSMLIVKGTDEKHIVLGSLFMNHLRMTFDPNSRTIGMSVV